MHGLEKSFLIGQNLHELLTRYIHWQLAATNGITASKGQTRIASVWKRFRFSSDARAGEIIFNRVRSTMSMSCCHGTYIGGGSPAGASFPIGVAPIMEMQLSTASNPKLKVRMFL